MLHYVTGCCLSLMWQVLLHEEACLGLGSALGTDLCTSILFSTFQRALLQLIIMNLSISIWALYLPGECFNFWNCYGEISEFVAASAAWNLAVYLLPFSYLRDASTWESYCFTWQQHIADQSFQTRNLGVVILYWFLSPQCFTKNRATIRAVICLLSTAHE